jgi:hypothetical protein
MHKDIIRSVSDFQERLVSFLALQSSVLLQRTRAEPVLNDLTVFTELRPALEVDQYISPTHPMPRPSNQVGGDVQVGDHSHLTQHDQRRTTGIDCTPLLQEISRGREGVEDQNRLVEDAEVVNITFGQNSISA